MKNPVLVAIQQVRPLAENLPEPSGPLGSTRIFRTNDLRRTDYSLGRQTVPTVSVEGKLVQRVVNRQLQNLWQIDTGLDVSPLIDLPHLELEEALRQTCGAVALDLVSRQGSTCTVAAFFEKGSYG